MSKEAMKLALEVLDMMIVPRNFQAQVRIKEIYETIEKELEKQEHGEPVAWMKEQWSPDCGPYVEIYRDDEMGWRDRKEWTPLYTTPYVPEGRQQRTWVGLTTDDKEEYLVQDFGGNRLDAMDWAEQRIKEKNT